MSLGRTPPAANGDMRMVPVPDRMSISPALPPSRRVLRWPDLTRLSSTCRPCLIPRKKTLRLSFAGSLSKSQFASATHPAAPPVLAPATFIRYPWMFIS
ncbi:hypothetical protein Acr_00g0018390 [Actinidia rufa]|uniref:Uncharacterized protein n=1 Tax=Actinidia rufa TaxID=165716 RepID=A0A7J0DBG0_9ERIC|nr:hypothetical protein Acr_00g0018390 [Actinidia rufa]